MATDATAAPNQSKSKKIGLEVSTNSGQGKSRPVPIGKPPLAALVIAASKPRNPIAVDALLKKSGPHVDKRRAQKIRSREQLQSGLDEARRRNADD